MPARHEVKFISLDQSSHLVARDLEMIYDRVESEGGMVVDHIVKPPADSSWEAGVLYLVIRHPQPDATPTEQPS